MQVSTTTVVIVIVLVVLALFLVGGCSKGGRNNFTRTCLTADTNCKFVRTPVDYIYGPLTAVNERKCKLYPHWMADITDELQPLDHGPVNLGSEEDKLWNPHKLWRQYENDWRGCGNGRPYIMNDEKTRFSLAEVGDIWAKRILESTRSPAHGPIGACPALTDEDMIRPEPYEQLYGGSWLANDLGD